MTSQEKALKRNSDILELRSTVEKHSPEYWLKLFDSAVSACYSLTFVFLALIAYCVAERAKTQNAARHKS